MAEKIAESATGFAKFRGSDGSTFYKDPSGQFTNQQAFAGSKQQEKYTQRRNDKGQIVSNEPKRDETPERTENYRSTGILEDEYEDTNTDFGVEVWIVTDRPTVTEREVWGKLQEAMQYARREIPVINGEQRDAKIQTNQRVGSPTHGWRGKIRVKGNVYTVNFGKGAIEW